MTTRIIHWQEFIKLVENALPCRRAERHAIPTAVRREVLQRDNRRCRVCNASAKERRLDLHHVQPGGESTPENLVALDVFCHQGVHAMLAAAEKLPYRSVYGFKRVV